mgnify:CR=1 FL=1
MGIFDRLFNSGEKDVVTSRDLKIALMGVKRERRKKQMEIRRHGLKQTELIARVKKARRDNNVEEVDFLYEELQQIKIDTAYAKREAKILNLEGIGLQRYLRGLERLEKTGNRGRIRELMERVSKSHLDEKLRGQVVDEEAYLDSLTMTLDDVKMELEDVAMMEDEDPDKDKFLREIDEIIAAEEEGNLDAAVEREQTLKQEMETESEPEF